MKRIEIIIPHRLVDDAHEIIEGVNTGGMSYYSIEGSGRVKAERIIIGRGTEESKGSSLFNIMKEPLMLLLVHLHIFIRRSFTGTRIRKIHRQIASHRSTSWT